MNIGKHIGTNWIVKEDSLSMMRSVQVNRSLFGGIVDLSTSFTGSFESGDHEKPIQNPLVSQKSKRSSTRLLFFTGIKPARSA
ncbi:Uncharacterised protein [Actinobacillus pleuropneumoniae]|nr:Uncharacterised protein [Actinobacillus pleuropneumoniae]